MGRILGERNSARFCTQRFLWILPLGAGCGFAWENCQETWKFAHPLRSEWMFWNQPLAWANHVKVLCLTAGPYPVIHSSWALQLPCNPLLESGFHSVEQELLTGQYSLRLYFLLYKVCVLGVGWGQYIFCPGPPTTLSLHWSLAIQGQREYCEGMADITLWGMEDGDASTESPLPCGHRGNVLLSHQLCEMT